MDLALYEKCSRENNEKVKKSEAERDASNQRWKSLIEQAASNGVDVNALL